MVDGANSNTTSLFADHSKIMRIVDTEEDGKILQEDLGAIHKWNQVWEVKFNALHTYKVMVSWELN